MSLAASTRALLRRAMEAPGAASPAERPRARAPNHLAITDQGLEILGDAVHPGELERLLQALNPETIEQMQCG